MFMRGSWYLYEHDLYFTVHQFYMLARYFNVVRIKDASFISLVTYVLQILPRLSRNFFVNNSRDTDALVVFST